MQERKTKESTPDRSQNKGRPVSAPNWHSFGSHLLSTVELFLKPKPSSTAPEWHQNHHITGALLSLLGHKMMSGLTVSIGILKYTVVWLTQDTTELWSQPRLYIKHESKPQNLYKLSHTNNKMYKKMCCLKKFKGNLMIIICEMWIHIPLQTQHANSTNARTLIILDHKGRWCILYHDNYNRQSSCQV
jgi:hypothetical protein